MKLKPEYLEKLDPLTEEVLMQARGEEELIAIASLEMKTPPEKEPFHPKDFPSYQDYRRALIDYRKREYAEALGETIRQLKQLPVQFRGGELSRVAIVQGTAQEMLQVLELPGVRQMTLDRLVALPDVAPQDAIERIAELYIETLWPEGAPNKRKRDLVYDAAEQYIINYNKRHNNLRILGMQNPVKLESIYTAVQFLKTDSILRFVSLEGLEQLYRDSGDRGLERQECDRRSGLEVANEQQYLLVLGQPGSGKSTFLRKVGLEAMKLQTGEFQHCCLPVMLELKRFREDAIDIKTAIVREFRECQFPEVEKFCNFALEQGKLLVLLDGFDEVPTDNQKKVFKAIEKFVEQYQANWFIISCRTAAYKVHKNFEKFSEVILANFEDTQINQFINNWFRSEEDREVKTAERCWSLLNQSSYKSVKELAKTPLLLTLLCLVYGESQQFPKNRARLYSKALNTLMEKWSAQKHVKQDPVLQAFGLELEKIMLSEIAYNTFEQDKLFLSKDEIIKYLNSFLASNLNSSQTLNANILFDAIEIQQGIFVERTHNIYSFSHLTIQEYLTAQYIVENHKIDFLVEKHFTDQNWTEIFFLVSGLLHGEADISQLFLLMENQNQKYIESKQESEKIQSFLKWINLNVSNSM
ncbi:MAG: NACHT domain-containing protein, partial [Cyanobacteria bacterium P01_E01_bin.42]